MENAARFSTLRDLGNSVGWTTFTCPPAFSTSSAGSEAVNREHLLRLKWVSTSVPLDVSISGGINQELIRNVRKQLHLSQREAAEPFGGGPNAFSRYERGSTEAPQPLVQGCTSLLGEFNCPGSGAQCGVRGVSFAGHLICFF